MPHAPVLYYRTEQTKTTGIDRLPSPQRLVFEGDAHLSQIITGGTGNTVIEPQYSDGVKSYHKQQVGGISEFLRLTGSIEITSNFSIAKLLEFYRRQRQDSHFAYGDIGFYHDRVPFFNLNPTNTRGYTLEPPIITYGNNVSAVSFDVTLILGGTNL